MRFKPSGFVLTVFLFSQKPGARLDHTLRSELLSHTHQTNCFFFNPLFAFDLISPTYPPTSLSSHPFTRVNPRKHYLGLQLLFKRAYCTPTTFNVPERRNPPKDSSQPFCFRLPAEETRQKDHTHILQDNNRRQLLLRSNEPVHLTNHQLFATGRLTEDSHLKDLSLLR